MAKLASANPFRWLRYASFSRNGPSGIRTQVFEVVSAPTRATCTVHPLLSP